MIIGIIIITMIIIKLALMLILMAIMMTKPECDADDTDVNNDSMNDSYTAAGAGSLVVAPWSGPFGPGPLVQT